LLSQIQLFYYSFILLFFLLFGVALKLPLTFCS